MAWELGKTKDEIVEWAGVMKESFLKRKTFRDWTHFYFDTFNETFEHMHYTLGHVVGWYLIIAIIYNAGAWLVGLFA